MKLALAGAVSSTAARFTLPPSQRGRTAQVKTCSLSRHLCGTVVDALRVGKLPGTFGVVERPRSMRPAVGPPLGREQPLADGPPAVYEQEPYRRISAVMAS